MKIAPDEKEFFDKDRKNYLHQVMCDHSLELQELCFQKCRDFFKISAFLKTNPIFLMTPEKNMYFDKIMKLILVKIGVKIFFEKNKKISFRFL